MKVFSGLQPSGDLHIGNYLGMLKTSVELQKDNDCVYCIVDLHALTENLDPARLRQNIIKAAASYLAVGIDSQKSVLFTQSDVSAHAEFMWILTSLASVGDLKRMTQYKDKIKDISAGRVKNGSDFINAGLLMYPVLMASDILLYKTEGVPVGEDQKQHLELSRRLARRFNSFYPPPLLIEAKTIIPKTGGRVMSLKNPKVKMSKSHGFDTYIGLFDAPEVIAKKIKSAITDSGKGIVYDPNKRPALANLLLIYGAFSDRTPQNVALEFSSLSYVSFKEKLTGLLIEKLTPFREKYLALSQSPANTRAILKRGAERAESLASPLLREAKERVGIGL